MSRLTRGHGLFVLQQRQVSVVAGGEPQRPEDNAETRREIESHRLLHVDLQGPLPGAPTVGVYDNEFIRGCSGDRMPMAKHTLEHAI